MADYDAMKAAIRAAIYDNVTQAITGDKLQEILLDMVDEMGAWTTSVGGTVSPGISLAKYVCSEFTRTGIYSFAFYGFLDDHRQVSVYQDVVAIVLRPANHPPVRIVMVGNDKIYAAYQYNTSYFMTTFVRSSDLERDYYSKSQLEAMAETWTFTLSDDTTVTKKIIVLP